MRELERKSRNSLTVAAGDLIGGSPLLSALYHDEPTIKAMNMIGLDLASVGNHEFDEGADELKRMQRGGCHPVDGCRVSDSFDGADFKYLAANVIEKSDAKPFFRPYAIRRFQGKKIGFIGMTLEGTPSIVAPSGIANLSLLDEAATEGGPAVLALMNPGGVRADLVYADSGTDEDEDGRVSYEEAFTVQPFNNLVTTQTFTGAQLLEVLKDQWCGTNSSATVLLPSNGFHYTWDKSIAADILGEPCAGAANPVSGVTIGRAALDPAASYRITTNNFLADGGDDFLSLTQGTNRTTRSGFDIDSLTRYLAPTLTGAPPIGPPALDRIDVQD